MTLLQTLAQYKSFALFGHGYIDGDALWSILWLWWVLEKQGKDVSYFTPYAVPSYLHIVEWREKVSTDFDYGQYDCVVFCDFTPTDRIGSFADTDKKRQYFDDSTLLVVDHHIWDCDVSTTAIFKDTTATSNCERIRENIKDVVEIWKDFTEKEATALYLWLTTDSWNFMYDKGSRTLRNAYELVSQGADKQHIINAIYRTQSLQKVLFTQEVLWNIAVTDGILYSEFYEEDLEKYGMTRDDGKAPLSVMASIGDINLVILNKRVHGESQLSLRSNNKVDCSALASHFGGGWHKNAAWCRVDSSLQADEIVTKMREMIANGEMNQ